MTGYLLDTNIVSDLVRQPRGNAAQRLRSVGHSLVATSAVVSAELWYGATKKGSEKLTAQLRQVLGALDVLPFEPPADVAYGSIRTALEQLGQPIGGNDLLVAAQAVALGFTLVSDNEREFRRIPELRLENWLR